ncbi:hypothetical protein J6590_078157 [Homalodisca vitripennis]|nr:hypothetical protein J6590_078157 [Homalodisca vitripennis]
MNALVKVLLVALALTLCIIQDIEARPQVPVDIGSIDDIVNDALGGALGPVLGIVQGLQG